MNAGKPAPAAGKADQLQIACEVTVAKGKNRGTIHPVTE